jgi:hypothetical protein
MAAESLRMLNSLLLAFRLFVLVFSGHRQIALENIALRHQLLSSHVRKSDHDCAIEIDYFGLRSRDSGRTGDLLSSAIFIHGSQQSSMLSCMNPSPSCR